MSDRLLVRMIAAGLLAVVILGVAAITLTNLGHDRLTIVGGITTTALGALTAFLVSTRSTTPDTPTPVVEAPATVVSGD